MDPPSSRVLVLMYHDVSWSSSSGSVSPTQLEEQLAFLDRQRIDVIPLVALHRFLDGKLRLPQRSVVITVDDGIRTAYSQLYPLLRARGLPFTLALNTWIMELRRRTGGRDPNARKVLTWEQVGEMLGSGLATIGCHSHRHPDMRKVTGQRSLEGELVESRRIIRERTGERTLAFFYPFGSHDSRVRREVEAAGYRFAYAAWGPVADLRSPRFAIPRKGLDAHLGVGAVRHWLELD